MRWFENLCVTAKLAIPAAVMALVAGGIVWYAKTGLDEMVARNAEVIDVLAARRAISLRLAVHLNAATIAEKNTILEQARRRDAGL